MTTQNSYPDHILSLNCLVCGRAYTPADIAYVCPEHGLDGVVDVRYDYDLIQSRLSKAQLAANRDTTIWRYKPLLPIFGDAPVPPLTVGGTPLYDAPRLAKSAGIRQLWVKDDGRLPTGSFKDRASAIAIIKAQEVGAALGGAAIITTASTGNAAAALSGLCASVGQANVIFVPASAPPAKIAQLLVYGSKVVLVEGSYDDAFELCGQAAAEFGWYNRNTGFNPYMSEGKKTAAFEICEQLGWQVPDVIVVSVGDGCIIGGIHKGLRDLHALGWIERIPRLIGVQAAGSNYLAAAWTNGEDVLTKPAIAAHTVADSISAGLPRDRLKAMAAITQTAGAFVTVSDEEILAAIPTLARGSGVFAEPAGAAAYAGLVTAVAQGQIQAPESAVLLVTGNGLKDVASAQKSVSERPLRIPPDLDKLQQQLKEWLF